MSEIKLTRRYPGSKPEDITDAYMRGIANGIEINNKMNEKQIADLVAENAKMRDLISELYESAWLEYPSAIEHTYGERVRELGIKVDEL